VTSAATGRFLREAVEAEGAELVAMPVAHDAQ
jgi:hypothetical protein